MMDAVRSKVKEVVLALFRFREILLQLEIGGVCAVGIALVFMDVGDGRELDHLDGLVAALLGFEIG